MPKTRVLQEAPAVLNFEEAAVYLGIGMWRLRELLKERRQPGVTKDGYRLHFPKAMLDERRAATEARPNV